MHSLQVIIQSLFLLHLYLPLGIDVQLVVLIKTLIDPENIMTDPTAVRPGDMFIWKRILPLSLSLSLSLSLPPTSSLSLPPSYLLSLSLPPSYLLSLSLYLPPTSL